jgi:hypothetical protein
MAVEKDVQARWLAVGVLLTLFGRPDQVSESRREECATSGIHDIEAKSGEIGMDLLICSEFRGEALRREVSEERVVRPEANGRGDVGYSPSGILRVERQQQSPEEAEVLREQKGVSTGRQQRRHV